LDVSIGILSRIASGELWVSSSSSVQSTAISSPSYGYLPILVLLPLGVLGGLLIFKTTYDHRGNENNSIVLVSWGVALSTAIIGYSLTGLDFVLGRAPGIGGPLLYIASGVGVAYIRTRSNAKTYLIISCIILLLISASFALRATTPQTQIQSYPSTADDYSKWTHTYTEGDLYGGMKLGAPLAAEGDFRYMYPQSKSELRSMFYSENESQSQLCEENISYLVLSDHYVNTGVYALGQTNKPMSQNKFDILYEGYDSVYNNGGIYISHTPSSCSPP
jgi:hypothetical protein